MLNQDSIVGRGGSALAVYAGLQGLLSFMDQIENPVPPLVNALRNGRPGQTSIPRLRDRPPGTHA